MTPRPSCPPPAPAEETLEQWAQRIAATLPPMTPEEAAATGRLAAKIDARIRATA